MLIGSKFKEISLEFSGKKLRTHIFQQLQNLATSLSLCLIFSSYVQVQSNHTVDTKALHSTICFKCGVQRQFDLFVPFRWSKWIFDGWADRPNAGSSWYQRPRYAADANEVKTSQYQLLSLLDNAKLYFHFLAHLQIRAYLNERPPLSGSITVADPLQPSRLKLGARLRYHLKAYENTNSAIRGFF